MDMTSSTAIRSVTLIVLALLQVSSQAIQTAGVLQDGSTFDFVIIGGGTAGCILASRLSEIPDITVALLETGTQQPAESVKPRFFQELPTSKYDYNFKTEGDEYTALNLQGESVRIIAGKMLSGTSGLHDMLHLRSHRADFEAIAEAAQDQSWGYDEMLKYYIKSERLEDLEILKSVNAEFHGKDGPIGISRAHSNANLDVIRSFQQLGYKYELDPNSNKTLGIFEPLIETSNGVRQSTAQTYLRMAEGRENLFVYTQTTVKKILFDEYNTAFGVVAMTKDNQDVNIYVYKEVLLAAGVIRSPQILFLSGIGVKDNLESWGIECLADLPVGRVVRDKVGTLAAFKFNPTYPINGFDTQDYPFPVTVGYNALLSTELYPNFQFVNFLFPRNSTTIAPVCMKQLKYNDEICGKIVKANSESDMMLSVIYNLNPYSTGYMQLKSVDILDDPWIYMGYFRDGADLSNLATYRKQFMNILRTPMFRNSRAEFLDLAKECSDLKRTTYEYHQCQAKALSRGGDHVVGTCALGSVLEADLTIKGMQGVRVVDASAIPTLSAGHIVADVIALAEKAADLIKADIIICPDY